MRKSNEIRQERSIVLTQAREVRSQIEASDGPSDELMTRFDELMNKADTLDTEARSAEAVEARFAALDQVEPRAGDPLPHQDPANTRQAFSLSKAMREARSGRLTGLEAEVAQEIALRTGQGLDNHTLIMPWDTPFRGEVRNLTTANSGGAISRDVAPTLIEALRARLILARLGASFLTNLVGDLSVPKQTAASTAGWYAEGTAADLSSPTIGSVDLKPKRLVASVPYSHKLQMQSSLDVEGFVQNDILNAIAQSVDGGGINGSGTGEVPRGILQTAGMPTIPIGTNGGPPTLELIIALEAAVDTGNALDGSLAYVTSPGGRGKLKSTARASGTDSFLWDYQENLVNGYPALSTNLVPSNIEKGSSGEVLTALIFGDFSQVMVGMWGGARIVVNPYSLDREGQIRVTIEQLADIKFRHDQSFAKIADMSRL